MDEDIGISGIGRSLSRVKQLRFSGSEKTTDPFYHKYSLYLNQSSLSAQRQTVPGSQNLRDYLKDSK